MSIGFLKRLLLLLNIGAILTIAGAAYGFVSHRNEMRDTFDAPGFGVPTLPPLGGNIPIGQIGRQLGLYPKQEEPTETKVEEKKQDVIESVLARLGSIKAAIVAYEPYDEIKPAIIFELKSQAGKMRTIKVGEAIESKPHPKYGDLVLVPVRYKFIRCEPDPENPEWTYFVFDMNCDGKDIQKAHWKGEGEESQEGAQVGGDVVEPAQSGSTFKRGAYLFGEEEEPETEPVQPETQPEQPTTAPVEPEPFTERPSTLFEEDSAGSLALTDDGLDYLRDNYEKVLEDTRTRTYTDPKTRRPAGVRIVAIRPGSVANEFGIRPDDIILSINDRPVTRQSQAVDIVKSELNKKSVRYIRVKLQRQGRVLEKRFDSRDPATRAKAREAFRDRR